MASLRSFRFDNVHLFPCAPTGSRWSAPDHIPLGDDDVEIPVDRGDRIGNVHFQTAGSASPEHLLRPCRTVAAVRQLACWLDCSHGFAITASTGDLMGIVLDRSDAFADIGGVTDFHTAR